MGFISELSEKANRSLNGGGQALWRELFGTDKESSKRPVVRPAMLGSSLASAGYAQKRLLQALRSMAPGGWSDNRWEQTAHFVGPVYVAIDRIGKMWQQAEFSVYDREPNNPDPESAKPTRTEGGERLIKLLERPNRRDSWGKLMYRWNQQLKLTGMALTYMVPSMRPHNHPDQEVYKDGGEPMELYCIPTATAIPQPAVNPDFPDGYYRIQPVYPYGPFSSYPSPISAVGAPIGAQWMMNFSYPHPLLRYDGYSPLTGLRFHIDELEMMDRSRHYKMRGSINPSAVLNLTEMEGSQPLPEAEIERIHTEWENQFQGPENHGKLIVGAPGSELVEWGGSPKEMDYQAGWSQLLDFILGGGFGITKPAAGMIEDSSYSVLFATLKQLYLLTLEPDMDDVARELTHFLAPFFGNNLLIKVRCKRIDDHDVTHSEVGTAIQAKCITKNEVRKCLKNLDLEPVSDEWGEEIAGADQVGQEQQPGLNASENKGPLAQQDVEGQRAASQQAKIEEQRVEPAEVTKTRPKTGSLGRGALGPRMSGLGKKSLYDQVTAVISNGHV